MELEATDLNQIGDMLSQGYKPEDICDQFELTSTQFNNLRNHCVSWVTIGYNTETFHEYLTRVGWKQQMIVTSTSSEMPRVKRVRGMRALVDQIDGLLRYGDIYDCCGTVSMGG